MLDLRWRRASPSRGSGNCWGILPLSGAWRRIRSTPIAAIWKISPISSPTANETSKPPTQRDYREYLHAQSRGGKSTRTVARRLAAIRVMLRFFAGDDGKSAKILLQLDRPKPEQSLPKILSRAQVNQLIAAPNPKSRLYFRDVAILELLYASGLRASELCSVKLRDLNRSVGVIRVLGKGAKERIVPVGQPATGGDRPVSLRMPAETRPERR